MSTQPSFHSTRAVLLPFAILCVAVNVGLGALVHLIKLPVYVDAAGTLVFSMIFCRSGWAGFAWSAAVGILSFVLVGVLYNPVAIWFTPTQVAIAGYGYWIAGPLLNDRLAATVLSASTYARIVALGLGLGAVAGLVSAPIIARIFGGVTGAGASLITAWLLKSGETLFTSVLASGLASEPLDKLLQLSLAVAMIRATPRRFRSPAGPS